MVARLGPALLCVLCVWAAEARANQQVVVGGTLGWTFGKQVSGFTPGVHVAWHRVNDGNVQWRPMLGNELRVDAPRMQVFRVGTVVSVGVVNAEVADIGFIKRYGLQGDVGVLWASEGGLQPVLGAHADTFFFSWEARWAHHAGTTVGATLDVPVLPVGYLLSSSPSERQ